DAHGSVRHLGGEDVERLDSGWPIGEALGRAEAFAGALAVVGAALEDVVAVGGVDELVVGVVEILLVHGEPDQRPLDPWRLRRAWRKGGPSRAVAATSARRVAPLRRDGMEKSAVTPPRRAASAPAPRVRVRRRDWPASPASRSGCSPRRR